MLWMAHRQIPEPKGLPCRLKNPQMSVTAFSNCIGLETLKNKACKSLICFCKEAPKRTMGDEICQVTNGSPETNVTTTAYVCALAV